MSHLKYQRKRHMYINVSCCFIDVTYSYSINRESDSANSEGILNNCIIATQNILIMIKIKKKCIKIIIS